ncbi:MAG: hypothetical protein AB1817_19910, partial [Chloroflexota bacterium]
IASFIILWFFRPDNQPSHVFRFDILILMSVPIALGIILILYGLQRTSRRIIRLARAMGIYIFLGVVFWTILIGYGIRSGIPPPSFQQLLESLDRTGIFLFLWPALIIIVLRIFEYGFQ